jgi:hypothetical protein
MKETFLFCKDSTIDVNEKNDSISVEGKILYLRATSKYFNNDEGCIIHKIHHGHIHHHGHGHYHHHHHHHGNQDIDKNNLTLKCNTNIQTHKFVNHNQTDNFKISKTYCDLETLKPIQPKDIPEIIEKFKFESKDCKIIKEKNEPEANVKTHTKKELTIEANNNNTRKFVFSFDNENILN